MEHSVKCVLHPVTPSSDTIKKAGEHLLYNWLLDYQELKDRIEYLDFRLHREKRELKRWEQGDLYKVRLTEGAIASGLEERIFEYEYELANLMNDLFDTKRLISTFKGLENKILYYRYIEGMTLERVSIELGYSASYIYKKHAEIMKRIKFAHKLNLHFTVT